jgi:hypothetical protein
METNSYCYLRQTASMHGNAPARPDNWYFYLRRLCATGPGQLPGGARNRSLSSRGTRSSTALEHASGKYLGSTKEGLGNARSLRATAQCLEESEEIIGIDWLAGYARIRVMRQILYGR